MLVMRGDRFVDCNPAAVRMLRFPNREALLRRFSGKDDPEGRPAHPADLSPPLQPDGRNSFEKAEDYLELAFERGTHTFEWLHLCGGISVIFFSGYAPESLAAELDRDAVVLQKPLSPTLLHEAIRRLQRPGDST